MKNVFGRLFVTAVFVLAAGAVAGCFGQEITGGYGDADPKNDDIVKAAAFASKQLGTDESATIKVVRIDKARLQVVAGLNYDICMEVTIKRGAKKAATRYLRTVVYKDLKNRMSLSEWIVSTKPLKCGDSE